MSETKRIEDIWNEVDEFIIPFKKPEIIDIFTNGYCFYFARILQTRFNDFSQYKAEIYYNPVDCHFACLIGGKLWDVNGLVMDDIIDYNTNHHMDWYKWDYYMDLEKSDSYRVFNNCILKN